MTPEKFTLTSRFPEDLKEKLYSIYEQREEIVKAFIAKYGFEPDSCEQVVQYTEDSIIFYIRKKPQ